MAEKRPNLDNDHLVSIVRETETLDLVDFNHDWTDGYSTCNGSGVVRKQRPLEFFKVFWRLPLHLKVYGEAQRAQEVQKNTFGKYYTEGILR